MGHKGIMHRHIKSLDRPSKVGMLQAIKPESLDDQAGMTFTNHMLIDDPMSLLKEVVPCASLLSQCTAAWYTGINALGSTSPGSSSAGALLVYYTLAR
jgi:hypothetical protein